MRYRRAMRRYRQDYIDGLDAGERGQPCNVNGWLDPDNDTHPYNINLRTRSIMWVQGWREGHHRLIQRAQRLAADEHLPADIAQTAIEQGP